MGAVLPIFAPDNLTFYNNAIALHTTLCCARVETYSWLLPADYLNNLLRSPSTRLMQLAKVYLYQFMSPSEQGSNKSENGNAIKELVKEECKQFIHNCNHLWMRERALSLMLYSVKLFHEPVAQKEKVSDSAIEAIITSTDKALEIQTYYG